jgi:hypothetical protein
LGKTVKTPSGNVAGKRLLAQLVTQAITTGQVQFPTDEKPSTISVKDWMEFVKWAYQYIEPPVTKTENENHTKGEYTVMMVGSDGKPYNLRLQ